MTSKTNAHRNRFFITAVILATFFLIMMGIGGAILGDGDTPSINQEWKEILLLVLGAFLGSYSKVVDFWFNGNDTNIDGKPDHSLPKEPCDCDEPSDDDLDNF